MSRKAEIVDALWRESDLPLRELAKSLASDLNDEGIRQDLRELVRAGVVKQKEDSVDHEWFYCLSAQGILDRPVWGTAEDLFGLPVRDAGEEPEDFKLRYVKWDDDRRFRRVAIGKMTSSAMSLPGTEIDYGQTGAWVPVRVFVTWKEAGVDRDAFDLEDEP